jgi:hypothetical protein
VPESFKDNGEKVHTLLLVRALACDSIPWFVPDVARQLKVPLCQERLRFGIREMVDMSVMGETALNVLTIINQESNA